MVAISRRPTAAHAVREALRWGELVLRPDGRFNGVKILCTAEDAIAWLDAHGELEIVDIAAGAIAIVIVYWQSG